VRGIHARGFSDLVAGHADCTGQQGAVGSAPSITQNVAKSAPVRPRLAETEYSHTTFFAPTIGRSGCGRFLHVAVPDARYMRAAILWRGSTSPLPALMPRRPTRFVDSTRLDSVGD
jgi:hypothetical protein